MLRIETIEVDLDAFSIFTNDVIINNVLLENIKVNYYFNFAEQIISDNVRSLKQDLENKTTYSNSNKYFNIKNLNAKNIYKRFMDNMIHNKFKIEFFKNIK